MKTLLFFVILGVGFSAQAQVGGPKTAEQKRTVSPERKAKIIKLIKKDAMFRTVLAEEKKYGETCRTKLLQATDEGPQGIRFEAEIDCSVPDTDEMAGGVALMINIVGTSFDEILDNLTIKVNKAG